MTIKRYRISGPVIKPFVVGDITREELMSWADREIRVALNEEYPDVEEIENLESGEIEEALCRYGGEIVDCVLSRDKWRPQSRCVWVENEGWEYENADTEDDE